jgi:CRISPR-associated protein Csx10
MSPILKITFESDWHVGSGAGAYGHIDRTVRRHPEDDLPYVPAKTLTGILRDGCERVARGLDDGREGDWCSFVAALFGYESKGVKEPATTTPACVRIGPARFDDALRKALQAQKAADLRAALTFVKPGVKLDRNGVAQSKMLRMEEVCLAGAELEAPLEIDLPDGAARTSALAILSAGARAVERIGAKRRRGNGRCTLSLDDEPSDMLTILAAPPPGLPQAKRPDLTLANLGERSAAEDWHVIDLDMKLLAPVVVQVQTTGNVIASRDHIPGSLLLPALDKRLRSLFGSRADKLTACLAAGLVQIRNAYPVRDELRLLPVPACLMVEKDRPGVVRNELHDVSDDSKQRKQLREGYVPADGLPQDDDMKNPVVTVSTVAATHAVIDDQVQRPTERVGGVYTYEAIAPGQRLCAEIRIARSVLPELPALDDFSGIVRIGRAKKDDYGQVRIAPRRAGSSHVSRTVGQEFTLWLVSPLLARDERLRPITDADALAKWLGGRVGQELEVQAAFVRGHRDDGWNNSWNEPRPTRFGLAAGSCMRFRANQACDDAVLRRIEAEGLGERRGEGYGEIRIDPPLLHGVNPQSLALMDDRESTDDAVRLASTRFTNQLQKRAWRIGIRRQALAAAKRFAEEELKWTSSKPSNAQIGAVRTLFETMDNHRDRLKAWLGKNGDTDRAKKRRARLKDKWPGASLEILGKFADAPEAVWQHVKTEELPLLPGHDCTSLKRDMALEATRIFWLTVIGAVFDRRAGQQDRNVEREEEAEHGA